MANKKDINSTEKLLNVIRGGQRPSAEELEAKQPDHFLQQKKSDKISVNFPRVFKGRHHNGIGVDIGRDEICFAKMAKSIDGKPLIVDQKILKFDGNISWETPEFKEILKTSLMAFAGSLDDCDVWAMMNGADVNVQHIKIPIVPKKQLENVIYFTAKKENPIDEKDVIFDYEMQGEIIDQGIPKYSVMVYSAFKSEIRRIRDLFSEIGINLTGITIAPFAIQNIFRTKWINVVEKTFASLYVGYDFSRIDIFHNNNLVMTRGIKTGISSMMEGVEESVSEAFPNKKIDENRIQERLQNLFKHPGETIKDEDGIVWSDETVLSMIESALERLTRQIERTLEHYATAVGYTKIEKVYISSVPNVFYRSLLRYIGEQLGFPSESLDPLQGQNVSSAVTGLNLAEKAALVPVTGLALSNRDITPNAIFTYIEKNKEIGQKRINRGIFAAFAVALAVCFVILILQAFEYARLNAQQEKLQKELSLFSPVLSKEEISTLASDLKVRQQANQQYAMKYKAVAIIRELSLLTPENIRLIRVQISIPVAAYQAQSANVSSPVQGAAVQKTDGSPKEKSETVVIEGVILGERSMQDALLAQYVVKLENSPVLKGVSVLKSSPSTYKKKEILHFTISAKIG